MIIRLDLLGDVLSSMHAVEALHAAYPAARIVMLTLPYTAPLARLNPAVDEVVSVDTNRIRTPRGLLSPATWSEYRRTHKYVRSQGFDLCVSLSGRMASLCAFLSGARRTIGYSREAYPFLLSDPVAGGRYVERTHEVEYVRRLARHAGASLFPERASLTVPEEAHQATDRLLAQHDIAAEEKLVVIHAGSVHPSAKRWPPGSWSCFADDLHQATGARIVLIGSKSDEPVAREVVQNATVPIATLVGDTTVEELLGLLARADLVASGDSGPLHLAVALGRPVVAAYGPTDPRIYGPYNPVAPTQLHRKDLPCSPCYPTTVSPDCPLGDPICMRLVTVRQMVNSAVELLSEPAQFA
jgi:lipopolysaccharide heptosyltransferase II